MSKETKITFEDALAGLENATAGLKGEKTTLEAAIKNFELGIEYYNQCNDILDRAKQRIEIYSK